jgi:hypothetical protein
MPGEIEAQGGMPSDEPIVEQEQDGGQDGGDSGGEDLKAELDRARKALGAANKEAADRRKKLEAFEKAEQERQQAQLSAEERLKQQLAEAQAQAQAVTAAANERLVRAAVLAEASKLAFVDPSDAWRMLDRDGLAVGDDGEVTGAAEALKALAKAKPYLVKAATAAAPSIDGDRGRGASTPEQKAAGREQQLRQRFGI